MTMQTNTNLTKEELNKINKNELIEMFLQLQEAYNQKRVQRSNKKYLVKQALEEHGHLSVQELADIVTSMEREFNTDAKETSTKNISTLLTYLRQQDSLIIHSDELGKKYIFA